jgi:hypothetical protein
MINTKHSKCTEKGCDSLAGFGHSGQNAEYCSKHKKTGMVDVKHKMCILCNLTQARIKYSWYCLRCFIYTFPNQKISRNFKIKETHVTDFIKENLRNLDWSFDTIPGGCSKRRPDCFVDCFTHVVIVEIDENQHKDYDESCENKRIMQLYEDFSKRSVVFIRFNPDTYINKDGKKILSSFKDHNGLGIPIVRSQKEWMSRLNILKDVINHWISEIPEKAVTIEYLFYDSF